MAKKKTTKAKPQTKAKSQAKPAAKAAAKAVAKKSAIGKTASKSVGKASAKAVSKSAGKAQAKSVAKSAVKKAAKPAVKPSVKRGAKPTPKTPAAKKAGAAKAGAPVLSLDKARAKKTTNDLSGLFTPLDNRILIRRTGESDRTPGGLYIPETVSERPNQGKVVAVGRGKRDKKGRLHPLDVQLGDVVMFAPYAGSELEVGGEALIVLKEDEVLAIVKI